MAENVLTEAERAGVTQIVYLGGLGDDAPALSPHLRSRTETGAVLSSTTVPLTTLWAAVVVGRGSAETIVALVDRLPMMVAPRWVSTPTQPIALTDMVRYLTGVAGRTDALGESFDVGGPDVITYGEMIQRIARLRGKRPLIVKVPVLSPQLSSYWLHSSRRWERASHARSSRGCATRRSRATTAFEACSRPLHELRRRRSGRARRSAR